MPRNLKTILSGDIPDDVPDWVVNFHIELDGDYTPLQLAKMAFEHVIGDRHCQVYHVRSGLQFDVYLNTEQVVETRIIEITIRKPKSC